MYSLLFLGLISFLLSFVLTPLVRNRFRQWGVVDRPDRECKHHDHPVPRVGGIPLIVAYLCSFGLLALTPLSAGNIVAGALPFALRLLPAVLIVFATGLLDDLVSLKPWYKLAGQVAAAGAAYWAGVHVQAFGGHHFAAWWSLPLTLLWLVFCTNAVNLIDGVDVLAAGVGLFAAFTMLLAALLGNNFPLAIATVPLVGCLLGFLRFNFNPATIFLGDSGSLFVGFLLGCYGVLWSEKSATILGSISRGWWSCCSVPPPGSASSTWATSSWAWRRGSPLRQHAPPHPDRQAPPPPQARPPQSHRRRGSQLARQSPPTPLFPSARPHPCVIIRLGPLA